MRDAPAPVEVDADELAAWRDVVTSPLDRLVKPTCRRCPAGCGTMDTTMAAGWIAFWGTLAGAVVGALIAWLGGWLTMREHWKRERADRLQERLHTAVAGLQLAATLLAEKLSLKLIAEDSLRAVQQQALLVLARSPLTDPHLHSLVEEFTTDVHERCSEAFMTCSRSSSESATLAAYCLSGVAFRWTADPHGFAREEWPAEEFRTTARDRL
jgi:hypothetical protein